MQTVTCKALAIAIPLGGPRLRARGDTCGATPCELVEGVALCWTHRKMFQEGRVSVARREVVAEAARGIER